MKWRAMTDWKAVFFTGLITALLVVTAGYLTGDEPAQLASRALNLSVGVMVGTGFGFRFWTKRREGQ